MPRPRRLRRVGFRKRFHSFKPSGIPAIKLETSVLNVEEFESIRLKDFKKMSQKEAAEIMGISQPTFHRILLSARAKIADAIVNGKEIRIQGGEYLMLERDKLDFKITGGFRGTNYCICPKCRRRILHIRGEPCIEQTCPNCGSNLLTEE